jgi:ribosomal protein S11
MAVVKKVKVMNKNPTTKKKRKKLTDFNGVIHIHSSTNNTIISLTTESGDVLG